MYTQLGRNHMDCAPKKVLDYRAFRCPHVNALALMRLNNSQHFRHQRVTHHVFVFEAHHADGVQRLKAL